MELDNQGGLSTYVVASRVSIIEITIMVRDSIPPHAGTLGLFWGFGG